MEQSLETPGQPIKNGSMPHEHSVYMMLVDSAAQARDEPALRKYAPLLEELALRDEHRPYLGIAHRAWGVAHRLAGEHAEAEARLRQALGLFEGLESRWQIGRTLLELGELDLARSDRGAAFEHFSGALTVFGEMQALPEAQRTQRTLSTIA